MARRNYKRQIIDRIFKLTENEENSKKLKGNYYYMKFLGLNWDYTPKKNSMACNPNRYSCFEYCMLLKEIEKVCA